MTSSPTRVVVSASHVSLIALLSVVIMLLGSAVLLEGLHQVPELSVIEVILPPIVAWVYGAAGVVATLRRPTNLMGAILLMGSVSILAGGLALMASPGLWGVGILTSTTILAAMVHALHAFPTGRLRGLWSIITVISTWFVSLVLQVPMYLFGPFTPFEAGPDFAALELAGWVQRGAGLAAMASTAVLLATRVRDANRHQRRVLAPLFLYGIIAVVLVLLAARVFDSVDPMLRLVIQFVLIAGVPVAFLVALFRGGFEATGRLEELSSSLSTAAPTRRGLAEKVSKTIGDPTSNIIYWSESVNSYVDDFGVPVSLPTGRGVVEVRAGHHLVGAISYDKILVGERALVESTANVLALAVDREHLAADLLASRESLRASRERLVTAADEERRRIARDLHDGLQIRLVLIAVAASEAKRLGGAVAIDGLKCNIDHAIEELRAFVHGVMPAALTERGLVSALRELTDGMDIPVDATLHIGDERLDPTLETAAFMVVSESFSNIVKHARASTVQLTAIRDGDQFHLTVSDDGVGGARLSTTSGLGGLRDRVEAVGGTLSVTDAAVGGTVVAATFPFRNADAEEHG